MLPFEGICSKDFLSFNFNDELYSDSIARAIDKTGTLNAIKVEERTIGGTQVLFLLHDFGFLGGSLGCAEGETLVRALDYALAKELPVVLDCASGGARMQEGLLSLMQMAKVSMAVERYRRGKEFGLPLITILRDPTYGGVAASYAFQSDLMIGINNARTGFAGPEVILNTTYQMDRYVYDVNQPKGFQSVQFCKDCGTVDIAAENYEKAVEIAGLYAKILSCRGNKFPPVEHQIDEPMKRDDGDVVRGADYTRSRHYKRPQPQDLAKNLFKKDGDQYCFVELSGDGRVGADRGIQGGIGLLEVDNVDIPIMCIFTYKGHSPGDLSRSDYGMPGPFAYRTAARLMKLAEMYSIPVLTLVDTCGALPTFEAEQLGQAQAIAENLLIMAGLKTPIVSLVTGEGGSGGALGICMGNRVGILEKAYYSVISPEGAASILGRYKNSEDKTKRFQADCNHLANVQKIYSDQLKELGIVDIVIPELESETFEECPMLIDNIKKYASASFFQLQDMTGDEIRDERQSKFCDMGVYETFKSRKAIKSKVADVRANVVRKERPERKRPMDINEMPLIKYLAARSGGKIRLPKSPEPMPTPLPYPGTEKNAKQVFDEAGAVACCQWVRAKRRILITDTTFRDAHQSLVSTRVRTNDMLGCASSVNVLLRNCFSIEMWGGATFDVAMRFLKEDPWERVKELRKRIPNILFQMLLRGSNAVGYTSYPDNIIREFVKKAADAGIDVFRVFDCFNQIDQMEVAIRAVVDAGKIAEAAICFSGDFLHVNEKQYTLDYYKNLARQLVEKGAHIIAVKDMAGLLKPQMAGPLMKALREATNSSVPIHFHTHNTSSAALATALAMASADCDVVDCAIASMSDTTSQPSLNAFVAATQGTPLDTGIRHFKLEPLDAYWRQAREIYADWESGIKTGSARVYHHQIPGGQYSNLYQQCKTLGLTDEKWIEVMDAYHDVNMLLGDVIKVTPSSKVVGDLALYLVFHELKVEDLKNEAGITFPQSVIELFEGRIGKPYSGLTPEWLQKMVIGNKTPLAQRPGATLEAIDVNALKEQLVTKYGKPMDQYDVLSHLMFPMVYPDFVKFQKEFGKDTWKIPSHIFFGGMTVGESFNLNGSNIVLTRVSGLDANNFRNLELLVEDKGLFVLKIEQPVEEDTSVNSGTSLPRADAKNVQHVRTPLPGVVGELLVKEGDSIEKEAPLFRVSSLKMEVTVQSPLTGIVEKLHVRTGSKVSTENLLAHIVESK